jgi:hypothetical protein
MNKARIKALSIILSAIEAVKVDIETHLEDEQAYYDAMPEGFQSGERGDASQAAIDEMQSAVSNLEDAFSALENITNA